MKILNLKQEDILKLINELFKHKGIDLHLCKIYFKLKYENKILNSTYSDFINNVICYINKDMKLINYKYYDVKQMNKETFDILFKPLLKLFNKDKNFKSCIYHILLDLIEFCSYERKEQIYTIFNLRRNENV